MNDDELAHLLPLHQQPLLRAAIGRTLESIDRWLATTPEDFVARGGIADEFFARASGVTEVRFSGGVLHALSTWPSQLSVIVEPDPFEDDPYAERYHLPSGSDDAWAPPWLRRTVGAQVEDVRVYVFHDDVPSDEPRQVAISYVLGSGAELFYGTYLHGRLDGDELLLREHLPTELPAHTLSMATGEAGEQ